MDSSPEHHRFDFGSLGREAFRAWRSLLAHPFYCGLVVATMALGIGPSSAIVGLANSLLFQPLPYTQADRLVVIWQTNPKMGWNQRVVAPANFMDWSRQSRSFDGMAAFYTTHVNLSGADQPERLTANLVTGDFFPMLKVPAGRGRTFNPGEFTPGEDDRIVISDGLWRRSFGGDPGVIGRKVIVDSHPRTVVGVMPPGFQLAEPADAWMPLILDATDLQERTLGSLVVLARFRAGSSVRAAQSEMDAVSARLAKDYPATNAGSGARVVTLREQLVGGPVEKFLLVLLAAAAVVLLIACVNVTELLLARSESREKAVALRVALGGRRWEVAWPVLVEATSLTVLGGLAGLFLASQLMSLFVALLPDFIPNRDAIGLDPWVFAFTLVLSVLTGASVAAVPALRASRPDLTRVLKESSRGSSLGRQRLLRVLVVVEVSLALLLMCGAGLMVRSFLALRNVDPGFDPGRLLTMKLVLPQESYAEDTRVIAAEERLLEELRQLPGVEAAGAVSHLPLGGSNMTRPYIVEGRPVPEVSELPKTNYRVASSDYFRTLGIPLRAGRAFGREDDARSTPKAIISQSLAEAAWPGESALGKRISLDPERPVWREVVGVVGDIKHWGLDDEEAAFVYTPLEQTPRHEMGWVIRTAPGVARFGGEVRRAVSNLDPNLPVSDLSPMGDLLDKSMTPRRIAALLCAVLSGVAFLLSITGIYGIMAYSTGRRVHEIGIRMAIGARRSEVLALIVRQGLTLVLVGLAIGLAAALAASRVLQSLLFGVAATDIVTFAIAPLFLAGVALLAILIPARRATEVDPNVVLRSE